VEASGCGAPANIDVDVFAGRGRGTLLAGGGSPGPGDWFSANVSWQPSCYENQGACLCQTGQMSTVHAQILHYLPELKWVKKVHLSRRSVPLLSGSFLGEVEEVRGLSRPRGGSPEEIIQHELLKQTVIYQNGKGLLWVLSDVGDVLYSCHGTACEMQNKLNWYIDSSKHTFVIGRCGFFLRRNEGRFGTPSSIIVVALL
jgi:hypothetical protein